MFILAAFLLGCQPEAPLTALEACRDQACRTAALLPAWQADPDGTRRWLTALEDPTVQATLIEGLALERPDDAATLCRELPEDAHARVRCERRVVRPHLEGRGKPAEASRNPAEPGAPGPRSSTLPLLQLDPPPWRALQPKELEDDLTGCDAGDALLCGRLVSREHAAQGDWELAGRACAAGDPSYGDAHAECLFQAAEVLAESLGAQGIGHAMHLCSWSSYGPMCVAHALTLVGPRVPPAEALTEDDIQAAMAVVEALRTVSEGQPALQASWVDRYWSSWTYSVFVHARTLDGRIADLLPPEALPHLSVAMAARLMGGRDPTTLELEPLAEELRAALATPGEPAVTSASARRQALVTNHRVQTWASDRKDERTLPSAWVMGPARRVISEDPAVDLRIGILEAAAQLRSPPPASFYLGVVSDDSQHRLVRWTAARIGAFLDPTAAATLAATLQDPDPLVQMALTKPRRRKGDKKPRPPGPSPAEPQRGGPR